MSSQILKVESDTKWRGNIRLAAFCLYAVCSMISQALMSVGVAILFAGIIVGAGGIRPLWGQLRELVSRPGIRGFFIVSLGFVFAIILSLFVTWFWPVTYDGRSAEVRLPADVGKTWYFFAPFITAAGLLSMGGNDRRTVLRVWILAFLAVSVVGLFQVFTGWPRAQLVPTHPGLYHAVLFMGHHLSVSSILIFPFFAALDLAASRSSWSATRAGRAVLWAAVLVGFVTLYLTFSRAVWVALPVALIVWSIFRFGKKAAVATVALLLVAGVATQIPAVSRRFTQGGSLSDRQELWIANMDFFKARPLTGVGFRKNHEMSGPYLKEKYPKRTWIFAGHAHNNLLDMLGGLGLIGTLFWVLWSGWVVWIPWKAWRLGGSGTWFAAGLVATWVAFQMNGLTQVNFWEGKVMHQMMWGAAWGIAMLVLAAGRRGHDDG